MKIQHISWITAFMLLLTSQLIQAAPCSVVSVSSSGFSTSYISSNPTNVTSTTLTVTCQKIGNDARVYTVEANNGLYFSGTNRASFSGNYIGYSLYQNSTCTIPWNTTNPVSFTFATAGTTSQTRTVYGCIPRGQNSPVGTYYDTVGMSVKFEGAQEATGTFPVMISTQASCDISSPPGTVEFSYTAFQNTAATANTTFGVACNGMLPYTMSLDQSSGVVGGLNYTLGINTLSSGGSNSLGASGTGVQQAFFINGSMPANQAGECETASCTSSQIHTLTVTY